VEAILFTGIQGSGKSTFYQERFRDSHLRINLDMLRTRRREGIIFQACLTARQPFVVDNTNVTQEQRARYILPARAERFEIIGYYFDTELDAALVRNRQRPAKQIIPDKGIRATAGRLQSPTPAEGFDRLYVVTIGPDNEFAVRTWKSES
jgi:predicted kinase